MRLAKLRGTPGIREDRVSEAERDLSDAQQKAEAARAVYEVGGWVGGWADGWAGGWAWCEFGWV
jgi:hypothetical protein